MSIPMLCRALALFSASALLFASSDASAYCRSRTCTDFGCRADSSGCIEDGDVLFRTSSCVSFSVQQEGSPPHDIGAEEFEQLVQEAFDRWTSVDCGGEAPSIRVESFGPVECNRVEYNSDQGNSNLILFHNEAWPDEIDANAFALTTVSFETTTGEIYDADMELNAVMGRLTRTDPLDGVDLPSILTHEAGHFLGLAHSLARGAVMRPAYTPERDSLRELAEDDIEGICAIYPPEREVKSKSCEPRHGFASACATYGGSLAAAGSCSAAPGRGSAGGAALGSALALLALYGAARRRSERDRAQTVVGA